MHRVFRNFLIESDVQTYEKHNAWQVLFQEV
jgi:hypothetical protein